jgi:hypothetical protein
VIKYASWNFPRVFISMALWQGVAMDSLNFHPGLPCPTLLHPAGGPPLNGLTVFSGATPHAIRLCSFPIFQTRNNAAWTSLRLVPQVVGQYIEGVPGEE